MLFLSLFSLNHFIVYIQMCMRVYPCNSCTCVCKFPWKAFVCKKFLDSACYESINYCYYCCCFFFSTLKYFFGVSFRFFFSVRGFFFLLLWFSHNGCVIFPLNCFISIFFANQTFLSFSKTKSGLLLWILASFFQLEVIVMWMTIMGYKRKKQTTTSMKKKKEKV